MRYTTNIVFSSALALMTAFAFPQGAFAGDPVNLQVTGTVVASPCEISGNADVPVNLGDSLQTADLNAAGSSSAWIPVNVSLQNCPAGTSSVTATFSGDADAADPESLYVNSGDAKNVAVQLQGLADEKYGDGKTATLQIADAADGKPTWNMQARAFSKNGGVTPGSIVANITMTFAYN
ncbi:fimbrial protein [Enterobacter sp. 118C5]|uniref:fimbrial protein n=1 Tax=Enterobacter TaxID=547 RepID=UPI002A7F83E8|nr:fimbrial protein [Enterobacter sp. 118C5]